MIIYKYYLLSNRIILILLLIFLSEISFSQNEQIDKILATYQESYNNRDWNSFSEIISDSFTIDGKYYMYSIIESFQTINSIKRGEDVEQILKISIENIDTANNQYFLDIQRTFTNYIDTSFVKLVLEKRKQEYILISAKNGFTPPKSSMLGSFYSVDDETFDKNKIKYIIAGVETKGLQTKGLVTYEVPFEIYVWWINKTIQQVVDLTKNELGYTPIEMYYYVGAEKSDSTIIFLNNPKTNNSILAIGGLGIDTSYNRRRISREIYTIYPHEYTETQLHSIYNITINYNRWFTDGLSELIGYKISEMNSKNLFEKVYLKGDYSRYENEYLTFKGADNLLDWSSYPGIAEEKPLVGLKYTYENDSGQYGRALQFFVEFTNEYGMTPIKETLLHFKNYKTEITQDELLNYMSEITGEDIKARVSRY